LSKESTTAHPARSRGAADYSQPSKENKAKARPSQDAKLRSLLTAGPAIAMRAGLPNQCEPGLAGEAGEIVDQSSSAPQLPRSWSVVLHEIEQSLAEADAALSEREKELDAVTVAPNIDAMLDGWLARLEAGNATLSGLNDIAHRAEWSIDNAAGFLLGRETALREWLDSAEVLRQRLADWDARSL
jgi:hypothetical protein